MKALSIEERVRVVDSEWNSWNAIRDTASRRQEEAFYVLDIGNIVNKYRIWKEKMPRVEPHYGI